MSAVSDRRIQRRWARGITAAIVVSLALTSWTVEAARGVTDCAVGGDDAGVVAGAVAGTLPEAENWSVIVAGRVESVHPVDAAGYRRVDMLVEVVFKGPTDRSISFYYPAVDEEDRFSFVPSRRYLVAAGEYNPYAPGLATDECTATTELENRSRLEELVAGAPSARVLGYVAAEGDTEPGPPPPIGLIALIAVVVLAVGVFLLARAAATRRRRSSATAT